MMNRWRIGDAEGAIVRIGRAHARTMKRVALPGMIGALLAGALMALAVPSAQALEPTPAPLGESGDYVIEYRLHTADVSRAAADGEISLDWADLNTGKYYKLDGFTTIPKRNKWTDRHTTEVSSIEPTDIPYLNVLTITYKPTTWAFLCHDEWKIGGFEVTLYQKEGETKTKINSAHSEKRYDFYPTWGKHPQLTHNFTFRWLPPTPRPEGRG